MATIQDYNFSNGYITEKRILTAFGFYPDGKLGRFRSLMIRRIICFIWLTAFAAHMTIGAWTCTFDEIMISARVWIQADCFYVKLIVFFYYNDTMYEIDKALQQPSLYEFPKKYLSYVKRNISRIGNFCNMYLMFSVWYIFMVCGYPVIAYIFTSKRTLALDGYVPCDIDNQYCYISLLIFHLVNFIIAVFANCAMDFALCILLVVNCSLFDILKNNLKDIDFRNFHTAEESLMRNIIYHNEILSITTNVDKLFGWIIFFHCLGSIGSMCLGIFTLIMNTSTAAIIEMVQFFILVLLEIGFPCWAGNNLFFKHQEVQQAIYMSNWYEADSKARKLIIIILERTKKPVIISGGGFFTVSLVTLTTIMKSAYSFLNVMLRLSK